MKIMTLTVEMPEEHYLAIEREAAAVNATGVFQKPWTVEKEINLIAEAAIHRRGKRAVEHVLKMVEQVEGADVPGVSPSEREISNAVPEIKDEPITHSTPGTDLTIGTFDLFARCVQAEAGNQSAYGRQLVADVILNRVDDPAFPSTIEDVILQPGQFSVVANGSIYAAEPDKETLIAVWEEMTARARTNYTYLYFDCVSHEGEYGHGWTQVDGHWFAGR